MPSPENTLEKAEKDTVHTKSVEHEQPQSTDSTSAPEVTTTEALTEVEDELEADDGYTDSAFETDDSNTTSITSSIYKGHVENGRRYQTKREGEWWVPADEKQFLSFEAAHIVYLLLDHGRKNPLFRSPIPDTVQNILEIGTGSGIWAKEVADLYPSALVQGINLSPPPDTWVPPNCRLEVDDILKPWEFKENGRFDFIHIRDMQGSFSHEQWRLLYKQAYNNLAPGGWIEEVLPDVAAYSDDGSLPADSHIANWGSMFYPMCEKLGKPLDTVHHFKSRIAAAGSTNIHQKTYKVPLGEWVKNPVLKEAGKFCKSQLLEGIEGYTMWALTHFGEPKPWTPEEVQVWLSMVRQEINDPKIHAYYIKKTVWAQKPLTEVAKAET